MKYAKTVKAIFIDRPNRFIAHVMLPDSGESLTVHVKNTGRCKELLIPGVEVILEDCVDNPGRKTRYDLISVQKKNIGWVNIDSQAPNKVVKEWLETKDYDFIKPEYVYGDSRIDFYMEKENENFLMEVKGCTLEIDGTGYFPDAPTERGVRHIYELIKAKKEGYNAMLAFVIQMEGVSEVLPYTITDPEFGLALSEAKLAGVKILFLQCLVTEDELKIADP